MTFADATFDCVAQANNDAILVERRKVAPFGVYTLVCFGRGMPSAV
jgi:phosphatidylethanolamine/phosphatidyl-N-methylethanolamine N-methyltransferase